MDPIETALSLGIPASVLLLVAVAGWEMRKQKRGRGTPLADTYVSEITALFYGTKRVELDHRDSMSMMREDDAEGAPPRIRVDLDRGVVVLRPDDKA